MCRRSPVWASPQLEGRVLQIPDATSLRNGCIYRDVCTIPFKHWARDDEHNEISHQKQIILIISWKQDPQFTIYSLLIERLHKMIWWLIEILPWTYANSVFEILVHQNNSILIFSLICRTRFRPVHRMWNVKQDLTTNKNTVLNFALIGVVAKAHDPNSEMNFVTIKYWSQAGIRASIAWGEKKKKLMHLN